MPFAHRDDSCVPASRPRGRSCRAVARCTTEDHDAVPGVDEVARPRCREVSRSALDSRRQNSPQLRRGRDSRLSASGHRAPDTIVNSTSGSRRATQPRSQVRRVAGASTTRRTISTFSCDIAYSDSPAASRAFARLAGALDPHRSCPSRDARTHRQSMSRTSTPLSLCRVGSAECGPRAPSSPASMNSSDHLESSRHRRSPRRRPDHASQTADDRGSRARLGRLEQRRTTSASVSADLSSIPGRRRLNALHGLPHDLDVLLRHRLLRQPGGFEGFARVSQ